ncbi:MAG: hypothetical protein AB7L13_02720 [Acidimicrobiia bacterium]
MRTRTALVALWLVATLVATTLAVRAMAFVQSEVTASPLPKRGEVTTTTNTDAAPAPTTVTSTTVAVVEPPPLVAPAPTVPSTEVPGTTEAAPVNRRSAAATSAPATIVETPGGAAQSVADRSRAVTTIAKESDDDGRDDNRKSQNSSVTTTTRRTNNSIAASPSSTTTTVAKVAPRTYSLVGGKTQIDFSPDGVTVKFATPDNGWKVIKQNLGGGAVEVRFVNGSSMSTIKAWWDNGARTKIDNASDKKNDHDDD